MCVVTELSPYRYSLSAKNMSKQDNNYCCYFLTEDRFDKLQGVMEQEGRSSCCELQHVQLKTAVRHYQHEKT